MLLVIKWNRRAINQFVKAIEYIGEESLQNAEKVQSDILAAISSLAAHPEKFSPDKYKLNNDSSFKAFELHHYRISYRFYHKQIRIIRIRHTKRNPKPY
jgi:plasmid stabilization system protein ParE